MSNPLIFFVVCFVCIFKKKYYLSFLNDYLCAPVYLLGTCMVLCVGVPALPGVYVLHVNMQDVYADISDNYLCVYCMCR